MKAVVSSCLELVDPMALGPIAHSRLRFLTYPPPDCPLSNPTLNPRGSVWVVVKIMVPL